MDFEFGKEQQMIRKSAKEFFEKECPKEKTRDLKEDEKGYDPAMWKKMLKLEFMGLAIPEEYGGTDGEYLDLIALMEEAGRNIVPSPYFATVGLCSLPILAFGTDEQKSEFLPQITRKGKIWTLALVESTGGHDAHDIALSATQEGENYVLNGTKLFVPYADAADHLLVVARNEKKDHPEEDITIFIVDAKAQGITITDMLTAARDKQCEVKFANVKVSKNDILGEEGKGWDVVEYIITHAAVLKCAEMSGAVQAVLDITVKYAKQRHQFDKPIGSFQAVQHRLVNMLTEVDGLKNLVYEAAWNINNHTPSALLSSMAKTKANKVYHRVCYDAVFTHGAIGWTEEMDISLYHLRSLMYENDCGGSIFHKERVARELESYKPLFLSL